MNPPSLTWYPSYTYTHSPTYQKWVKITATDIHSLSDRRGHDGNKNLWFHLNHPIQYVDLTAPIVAIESLSNKYALITIDDGSGMTIDVKITRLLAEKNTVGREEGESQQSVVDYPSNTTVANVNVRAGLGRFEVELDGVVLDVGMVIRVKCTVGTWFRVKQLDLQRANLVRTTRREVESWRELAKFKRDILSKPWFLSEGEMRNLEAEWKAEVEADRKKRLQWNQYMIRKEERERKQDAELEILRRQQEILMNEGALI